MKIMRIGPAGSERLVVEHAGQAYDASALGDGTPSFWADGVARVRAALETGSLPETEVDPQERVGSPVAAPSAVLCIGQNYAAHARESGAEPPTRPIVFLKVPSAIAGPNDDVHLPPNSSRVDWEVELGLVLGSEAWQCTSPEEALTHVAGYVLANDLSERKWQLELSGGQWSMGKCAPGFLPLGPWVVTADDFDPSDVRLRSFVDGEARQDSTTADMVFPPGRIVHELSQRMRLMPGDVIITGTPEGVAVSGRFPYLRAGNTLEIEIEGLGRQELKVTSG